MLDMAQQCRRSLHILSRDLDALIYDKPDFIDAIAQLLRRSRYVEIQVLVHDSTQAVKQGHRLISLHQKFTSYIHYRRIHSEFKDYNQALYIADDIGFVYRDHADRYEATINYCDSRLAKEYHKQFDEIWQVSEPDPQVRRLYI